MVKKVQLPVVGGIRKTIIIPDASLATTLAGFAGQTLTVAQLRALLGVSAPTNNGNGNIGPPGQGAAPKTAPQIMQFIFGDGGGGEDSPGPPGQAGPAGVAGIAGPTGATGPLGTTLVYVNTTVPGGNTVSNTTSETFFTSAYAIPAGTLAAGMVVRVRLFGVYSTGIVAPSLILKIYFGSTVMIASGTLTTVAGVTNDGWSAEGVFVVQTIGSSGTIEAQGLSEFSTASTAVLFVNMDNTAPVTVNTTISQTVQASVQWGGTVNTSDTITLREMTVEVISVAGIPVPPMPVIPVFFGEDGEDGMVGPPGATGPAGAGGGGGSNPYNISPDTHTTAVPAFLANDYMETAVLDTTGTRFAGATPWTVYNASTSSIALAKGVAQLTTSINAGQDITVIAQPITISTTAWRYRMHMAAFMPVASNNGGMYAYESGTGKVCQWGLINLSGTPNFWIAYGATFTTGGVLQFNLANTGILPLGLAFASSPIWLEIELAAGTITYRASLTGNDGSFTIIHSDAQTVFFTTTPDKIGFGGYAANGSTASQIFCDTFLQVA